jgi:hypothetical protein
MAIKQPTTRAWPSRLDQQEHQSAKNQAPESREQNPRAGQPSRAGQPLIAAQMTCNPSGSVQYSEGQKQMARSEKDRTISS